MTKLNHEQLLKIPGLSILFTVDRGARQDFGYATVSQHNRSTFH